MRKAQGPLSLRLWRCVCLPGMHAHLACILCMGAEGRLVSAHAPRPVLLPSCCKADRPPDSCTWAAAGAASASLSATVHSPDWPVAAVLQLCCSCAELSQPVCCCLALRIIDAHRCVVAVVVRLGVKAVAWGVASGVPATQLLTALSGTDFVYQRCFDSFGSGPQQWLSLLHATRNLSRICSVVAELT